MDLFLDKERSTFPLLIGLDTGILDGLIYIELFLLIYLLLIELSLFSRLLTGMLYFF